MAQYCSQTFRTFLLLILSSASPVQPANIFISVTILSSYSHHAGLEPLARALAERGHNVTFVSPFDGDFSGLKNKTTVTEWFPSQLKKANEEFVKSFGILGLGFRVSERKSAKLLKGFQIFDFAIEVVERLLEDPEYQDFVARANFDLFIVDRLIVSEVHYALAWKLKAKLITYSALATLIPSMFYLQGIPPESSSIPMFDVLYDSKEMSFWNRVSNEVSIFKWYFSVKWYYAPKLDAVLRNGYNDSGLPGTLELITMERIALYNQHYSDSFPRALPPWIVPVGGIAAKTEVRELPEDIEAFVSASDQGFIYVSFGSIITISSLPKETLEVFFDALASTEFRYLWKWEGQIPENGPPNVLFRNWFPQSDVLGHPKIKGFISQGGQVSISEAIYHGVPMIIFPVNGDQDFNAKRAQAVGNGIPMEFHGLTSAELREAIHKLTTDSKIRSVASKLSSASKKRPISALDTAVWWTEFVLAEDDLSYLKPSMDYNTPWWIQRNFDVMLFLAGLASLALAAVGFMMYLFIARLVVLFRARKDGKPGKTIKVQ